MTLPARRLCSCGCLEPIVRRPSEKLARFKARKFVNQEHRARASGPTSESLEDRICETCGRSFNRRRYKSGRLEGPRDYETRRCCPEHTNSVNGGEPRPAKPPAKQAKPSTKAAPFNPATRLPDPQPLQTLRDNPKNGSNMKRLPNLLEAERASGVSHKPVTIEQFKCAAGRAKRLHPDFAAMLRGEAVWGPVVGEVVV